MKTNNFAFSQIEPNTSAGAGIAYKGRPSDFWTHGAGVFIIAVCAALVVMVAVAAWDKKHSK